MRFLCTIVAPLLITAAAAGCATSGGVPSPEQIGERIEQQAGQKVRATAGPPEIPDGVVTGDGLTQEEAVAIALWNNPDFHAGHLVRPRLSPYLRQPASFYADVTVTSCRDYIVFLL